MNVYFFFHEIKSVYVDAFPMSGHCVQVALCFRGCSSGPAQGNNFISQWQENSRAVKLGFFKNTVSKNTDFSKTCFIRFFRDEQWDCLRLKYLRMVQPCNHHLFYLYGVCALLQMYDKCQKRACFSALEPLDACCLAGAPYGTKQLKLHLLSSSWKYIFNFTFYWNVACSRMNNSSVCNSETVPV